MTGAATGLTTSLLTGYHSRANLAKLTLLLAFFICSTVLGASAKETTDQAVATFKAGNYNKAQSMFLTALKTNPQDTAAHYYLALCYQKLNQRNSAVTEYKWIQKNSKDSTYLSYAAKGLAGIGQTYTAAKTSTIKSGKHPQVIDFSAVWCGPCKKFAPTFDRVAQTYRGRVDFIHADIDDPRNKSLVQQYQIEVVPTIVFLTGSGTKSYLNQGVLSEANLVQQTEKLLK